eukprot:3642941-Rhodomonas_salina.1
MYASPSRTVLIVINSLHGYPVNKSALENGSPQTPQRSRKASPRKPMTSQNKALTALSHSIALLQQANGDEAEMKSILERCRAENSSGQRRMAVDEASFTF